jgi:hypothetical protein
MAPKKIRCSFKECKDAAQRIVGDCGFCEGHFCAKHRLLEDHKCTGLEDVSSLVYDSVAEPKHSDSWWMVGVAEVLGDLLGSPQPELEDAEMNWMANTELPPPQCKKESHERNAAQLEAERTQMVRGV